MDGPLCKCFYFSHKGSAAPKKAGKTAGKGRGKPKKDESSADEEDDDDDIQEVAVVPKLAAKKVKIANFKLKSSLKIKTANTIFWIFLDIFRDYNCLKNIFFRNKTFLFF